MKIKVKVKGKYEKTTRFLNKFSKGKAFDALLNMYGKKGVEALSSVTPVDTGVTQESWRYKITETENCTYLSWHNDSATPSGIPIVILLKYGHATNHGGYVEGYDFISPAIRSVFDGFTKRMWEDIETS